jgi:hypothetical protein
MDLRNKLCQAKILCDCLLGLCSGRVESRKFSVIVCWGFAAAVLKAEMAFSYRPLQPDYNPNTK